MSNATHYTAAEMDKFVSDHPAQKWTAEQLDQMQANHTTESDRDAEHEAEQAERDAAATSRYPIDWEAERAAEAEHEAAHDVDRFINHTRRVPAEKD